MRRDRTIKTLKGDDSTGKSFDSEARYRDIAVVALTSADELASIYKAKEALGVRNLLDYLRECLHVVPEADDPTGPTPRPTFNMNINSSSPKL